MPVNVATSPGRRRNVLFLAMATAAITVLGLFAHTSGYFSDEHALLVDAECPSISVVVAPAPVELETVTIIAAMSTMESAEEAGMMLKSALMYQSTPINFHLIVHPETQKYIERIFGMVHSPVHKVQFFFYPLSYEAMERRLDRTATGQGTDDPLMGAFRTDHPGGYMGMMKLFLHEIISEDVTRAIWLDTDAFFLSDPILTWRLFDTFGPETGIMMPSHYFGEDAEPWQTASSLCSCVFLMDLGVLRRRRYMYSTLFSAEDKALAIGSQAVFDVWGPPIEPPYYNRLSMGDQSFFWATKVAAPEIFMHLPLSFEVTWCLWGTYGTRLQQNTAELTAEEQIEQQSALNGSPHEDEVIVPHILHFNCLPGGDQPDVFFKYDWWLDPNTTRWGAKDLVERWAPAILYHGQYKFIWLNKGTAKLTMTTRKDLRYWDERLAGRQHAEGYPLDLSIL